MNVLGSSPGGNRLDRYGRWIALAGVGLVVSGRLSRSAGVVVFGLAVAVVGIVLGLRAARSNLQVYVRQLIPGGTTTQGDPFARQVTEVEAEGRARSGPAYVGTVVWAGGIGKGVRMELSPSGLRIQPTWVSLLLMGKRPSWTLSWSTVRAAELAKLPGTGSAPAPVKFTLTEPSTVFLFISRTTAALS